MASLPMKPLMSEARYTVKVIGRQLQRLQNQQDNWSACTSNIVEYRNVNLVFQQENIIWIQQTEARHSHILLPITQQKTASLFSLLMRFLIYSFTTRN